ncbi:MAG: hypothetical protein EOR73_25620 [Mesorhizobium sp.]|nr:MAG: hypothetical protein EOR73_25620 [Mesorhizobium sp.]
MSRKLHELLTEVRDSAGASFSGIGLLISRDPAALPIVPLRPIEKINRTKPILDALLAMSDADNEFHDGFHVLSPDLELIRVSQYFSPPIVPGLSGDPARRLGGRGGAVRIDSIRRTRNWCRQRQLRCRCV